MARLDATTNPLGGQTDQLGGLGRVPNWQAFTLTDPTTTPLEENVLTKGVGGGTVRRSQQLSFGGRRLNAATDALGGGGEDWFEKVHGIPRRIDLGNILGTVVETIDLYNAFRDQDVDLDSFVNNAGGGVSVTDLPSLPDTLLRQDGLLLTLEVTTNGPPTIDGTLDFNFDVPATVAIPLTGTRVIIFPYRPESGYTESLQFLTDVFPMKAGREQRVALRKTPRQIYDFRILREEGSERTRLELLLFDWHARTFGLPVWHEPMFLTADATSGNTTISVSTTNFTDLRVGGLALVLTDELTFDALQIQSFTANSITFESPLSRDYPADTEVFPLRTAILGSDISASRRPRGMAEFNVQFVVLDNDPGDSFPDTSPFATFDGKVLLDGPNAIDRTLEETFQRRIIRIDNETGKVSNRSSWDRDKRISRKRFVTRTRQQLFEVRRLLHALRGRQVSFYIPTFYQELIPTTQLTSGSSVLQIENVGYDRFVGERQLRNMVRVELFDGTEITREIIDSSSISNAEEQLTVDVSWPQTIQPSEIRRIDFFELVRLDSDTVRVTHVDANGQARVDFPVKAVFE